MTKLEARQMLNDFARTNILYEMPLEKGDINDYVDKCIEEYEAENLPISNVGKRSLGTESGGIGTMDKDCKHDTEKLFDAGGNYRADRCKKCGGVY